MRPAAAATRLPGAPDIRLPGILLGVGLGGFVDGILLHQVLQWHHMLTSAGVPADTVRGLEINTFFDGLFHASTYIFVAAGLAVLWRHAHHRHVRWSTKLLAGTILMGFGIFNLVEGIIDHHLLELHHVRDLPQHVPAYDWIFVGAGGIGFIVLGMVLSRSRVKRNLADRRGRKFVVMSGAGLGVIARRTDPVHLLLTDVTMPRMKGTELASRLVLERPQARVPRWCSRASDIGITTNPVPAGPPSPPARDGPIMSWTWTARSRGSTGFVQ